VVQVPQVFDLEPYHTRFRTQINMQFLTSLLTILGWILLTICWILLTIFGWIFPPKQETENVVEYGDDESGDEYLLDVKWLAQVVADFLGAVPLNAADPVPVPVPRPVVKKGGPIAGPPLRSLLKVRNGNGGQHTRTKNRVRFDFGDGDQVYPEKTVATKGPVFERPPVEFVDYEEMLKAAYVGGRNTFHWKQHLRCSVPVRAYGMYTFQPRILPYELEILRSAPRYNE